MIKRYDFKNKYGRTIWAKIVNNDFKVNHKKEMGLPDTKEKTGVEEKIIDKYITEALVSKVKSKISQAGWASQKIPQLLHTVFYDLIREESWNFVKENKNPKIDFRRLMGLCNKKTKEIAKI